MTYEYDSWGNIQNKKIYAYTTAATPTNPTDTITYGYSTGEWKDQLTSYDEQPIVYDGSMGNPTEYLGKQLTWDGKELTGVVGTASYTYDMNGLRTTKTVNNVTTDYFYNNTVLMGFTDSNSNALLFSYDANGQVQAVNYNGTYYYYLRNGQGDIVKLIDGSGNIVVEYAYDSWGKPLSCTGTLAPTLGALNPFRYRGYVYDEETQWYYLKSRYYDPETCRFISADVLLSTGQGVIGHNCYVYCLNNPANTRDVDGTSTKELVLVSERGGGTATGHSFPRYFDYGDEEKALELFKAGLEVYYRGARLHHNNITASSFALPEHIFLTDNQLAPITLLHEYGHVEQSRILGFRKYVMYIAEPSLVGYCVSTKSSVFNYYYYSQPWERGADDYGQVKDRPEEYYDGSLWIWKAYELLVLLFG